MCPVMTPGLLTTVTETVSLRFYATRRSPTRATPGCTYAAHRTSRVRVTGRGTRRNPRVRQGVPATPSQVRAKRTTMIVSLSKNFSRGSRGSTARWPNNFSHFIEFFQRFSKKYSVGDPGWIRPVELFHLLVYDDFTSHPICHKTARMFPKTLTSPN